MSVAVTAETAAILLVFARLGAALMILPVFGEGYVLARARLVVALALAVLLTPVLRSSLPPVDGFDARFAGLVVGEVVHGLFIGSFVRLGIMALHIAGTAFAMQMGFWAATFFNPMAGAQTPVTGNLLTAAGLMMLLVLDGHHAMLAGLVTSYEVLPPGAGPAAGDMAAGMARGSADAVVLGVQMAMPITVVAVLLYAVLGMMNRLVPSLQVLFVAMPLQILIGLAVLGLSIGGIVEAYARFTADLVVQLGA
ncbi:MAG: flagellar biosynthetic protein FliR [Alphaproteobacteria bacterium]